MTPTRFAECLAILGWSERALADRLGEHRTTVRRWHGNPPPLVAEWLERRAQGLAADPAPSWRHA